MPPACFELIHNSRFDRADALLGTQICSPHLLQMQRDEPARKYRQLRRTRLCHSLISKIGARVDLLAVLAILGATP
jgi:hypothetical protein